MSEGGRAAAGRATGGGARPGRRPTPHAAFTLIERPAVRKREPKGFTLIERPAVRKREPKGFTLIELLLVVFIAAMVAGVTVPRFIRSMESARLRASIRTLVTSARYAQATAVLRQTPAALVLDTIAGRVDVTVFDSPDQTAPVSTDPVDAADESAVPTGAPRTAVTRMLDEGVRFSAVETAAVEQQTNGVYWIFYYPNGLCDGFQATLVDQRDREASVQVDRFSGRATSTW